MRRNTRNSPKREFACDIAGGLVLLVWILTLLLWWSALEDMTQGLP